MSAERDPEEYGAEMFELVPEFNSANSFVDLKGRLIVREGIFPKEDITPFPEVILPEANPIPLKALFGSTVAAALLIKTLAIGAYTVDNNADWGKARRPTPDFVIENKDILSRLNIGATLSPEQMGVNPQNLSTDYGKKMYAKTLETIDYMSNELGMTDIRMPVRWDNVVNEKGEFDFSFYKPFFDRMIKNKMNITINLGVKTARWDEQHVAPQYSADLKQISEGNGIVHSESELAKQAIAYETKVFEYLHATYSKEQLEQIKVIQLENEAFNKFGIDPVIMCDAYVEKSIENANKYFPKAIFAMNSAGFYNIEQITAVFKDLISKDPQYKNRLQLLINSYGIDLGSVDTAIGKVNPLKVPIPGAENVDMLWWDEVLFNKIQNAINESREIGFLVGVGEMQAEPWDGNPSLPGNPVEDFKYMLLRSAKMLDSDKYSFIGVWGIEYLVNNPTPANREILRLIGEINNNNYRNTLVSRTVENFGYKGEIVSLVTLPTHSPRIDL